MAVVFYFFIFLFFYFYFFIFYFLIFYFSSKLALHFPILGGTLQVYGRFITKGEYMTETMKRFSINQIKEDLENYGFYLLHKEQQEERIQNINSKMESLHGISYDTNPCKGGGSHYEDHLVDLIAQKEKIEDDIADGDSLEREFKSYFKDLTETQKDIIYTLWVYRYRSGIHTLTEKYSYSVSTIYRMSDEVLSYLARLRYGYKG